ncbi:MAG: metallophosphoesterase [Clostridia bacterium]|nr:metallophosphoesterase [Clostridia bacterium]
MAITFTVFSDFHYEPGKNVPELKHLEEIFERAHETNSALVFHCGDFARNWPAYPELHELYLNNKYSLPVYGTYGNHDTQTIYDTFDFITPRLTNDKNAVWATDDGKVQNGEITYYYADNENYRFIFIDTNHSYFPKEGKILHAPPGMGEAPPENVPRHVLGERQLKWLENTLEDAADKGLHCITVSHAGFAGFKEGGWEFPTPSYDIEKVREMFNKANKKRPNTVIMSINGHYHTDHAATADNILFFTVNSCVTGWWDCKNSKPYRYGAPLYSTVTISDDFEITIQGKQGCWLNGNAPENEEYLKTQGVRTCISNNKFKLKGGN